MSHDPAVTELLENLTIWPLKFDVSQMFFTLFQMKLIYQFFQEKQGQILIEITSKDALEKGNF